MIPIENKTDWNAIRAEYIGGGISQRKLAKKYGIAEGTLLDRANKEGWQSLRNQATIKTITKAEQKTAEAAAENAVLIEKAKRDAIACVRANIEQMQKYSGSKLVTKQTDSKGKPITVEFDLLSMVTALEKLQRMGGLTDGAEPVKVIIDV